MFFRKNKVNTAAKRLLAISKKIEKYRKDVFSGAEMQKLSEANVLINEARRRPLAEARHLFEKAEQLLESVGGDVFPMDWITDNAEVFLFASILALSVRTFFFQPFKIPTNSMYPTYSGMIFELLEKTPGRLEIAEKFLFSGAKNYSVKSPSSGNVQIPIAQKDDKMGPYGGILYYKVVSGRKFFGLLPSQEREYTFVVNKQQVKLRVPLEFSFDDVILEAFFPSARSWGDVLNHQPIQNFHLLKISDRNCEDKVNYFETTYRVKEGENLLNFNILSGDMLFVDKLSYHFVTPKIGDAFVFRTRSIEKLNFEDKYYIKRLVGKPNDILKIENGTLYRNGMTIDGADAFELNRKKVQAYHGYTNAGLLEKGMEVDIPENTFFAMGDNSSNSWDSRYWGFVPKKEVIGKAVFIVYPFTRRWGVSK